MKTLQQQEFIVDSSVKNGLLKGSIDIKITDTNNLEQIVYASYVSIFQEVAKKGYDLLFVRHFVPGINETPETKTYQTVYELFNAGRFRAFLEHFGTARDNWKIPAATAVGSHNNHLKIAFYGTRNLITTIENKKQVSAFQYSEKYGKYPPVFSRGAIYEHNGRIHLLAAGTASVEGEDAVHLGDIYQQVYKSVENLRILGSLGNLKGHQIAYGFAVEDVSELVVYFRREKDLPFLQRFVPKFFSPRCTIRFQKANICRRELLVEFEPVFLKKGDISEDNPKYFIHNNRIVTESFELHVSEHCNLRCVQCCNISPFNKHKFMSVAEVENICQVLKQHVDPDVVKISGGEPLLNPQLGKIAATIRKNLPKATIRITTNGKLSKYITETIWENIDQLWVSNYKSAPVPAQHIEILKQQARKYEVILNIKYVDEFSTIFVDRPNPEAQNIQRIYDDCWMRHRCLMIRNDKFYKCTRAAYLNDLLIHQDKPELKEKYNFSEVDGIPLQHPEFKTELLRYLNDKTPLESCKMCLGVSGKLIENQQMKQIR